MLRAVKDPTSWRGSPPRGPRPTRRTARSSRSVSPDGGRPTWPPTSLGCCVDFGHEQVDFTVVGSGPNGANPHHEAGDRVIQPGDAVVLDFGGLMFGYGSDTTRTVCVGEPHSEIREVHEIVRRGPGGRCRGGPTRRDLPGRRPCRPGGHHRCGLRRAVHPPDRPRHRRHHPRAALHDRGRGAAARPRDVLLGRARASISPGDSASASRTSSRSREDGGLRLNNTDHGLAVVE